MPDIIIDDATVFDNAGDRQVEFDAAVDTDVHSFAVRYDVLEALAGRVIDDEAAAAFRTVQPSVERAALSALGRRFDQDLVVIDGNDIAPREA